MKIKAVIGASYGDEGKGLMTDYLASQALSEGRVPAVIRFNGGAQAGHTVTTPDGKRHVFHHVGSAALLGVTTYLTEDFLVNPIVFEREMNELKEEGAPYFDFFVHPGALLTTPFDMVMNQLLEQQRQQTKAQHGSCGMGIYETLKRYSTQQEKALSIGQFFSLDDAEKIKLLKDIGATYYMARAKELLTDDWLEKADILFHRHDLIEQFMEGWNAFTNRVAMTTSFLPMAQRDATLIFEGAQGLMLDQRHRNFPHVTPSNTGTPNIVKQLKKLREGVKLDIETVYVTRAYVTRHGAGPLEHEIKGPPFLMEDKTNVPNPYQETLRYARFDRDIYEAEIRSDLVRSDIAGWAEDNGHAFKVSTAMTCLDQAMAARLVSWHSAQITAHTHTGPEFVDRMKRLFNYCSFGPSRASVWTSAELKHYPATGEYMRPFSFGDVPVK